MLATRRRLLALTLLALPGVVLLGCQDAPKVDPAVVQALRGRVQLAEEPDGAVTPVDLRESEGGLPEGEVVLVGQVGGVPNPWKGVEADFPWRAGEATFFLVDPGTAAEFADHSADDPDHAENCPFCASHAGDNADSVAVVTINGEDGKPAAVGAKELLSLSQDDTVVVRGHAKLAGNVLIVEASGVYVRK